MSFLAFVMVCGAIITFSKRFYQQEKVNTSFQQHLFNDDTTQEKLVKSHEHRLNILENALQEIQAKEKDAGQKIDNVPDTITRKKNTHLKDNISIIPPNLQIHSKVTYTNDTAVYLISITNVGEDLFNLNYEADISFGEGFPYKKNLKQGESIVFNTYDYGFESPQRTVWFTFTNKANKHFRQAWVIERKQGTLIFTMNAPMIYTGYIP